MLPPGFGTPLFCRNSRDPAWIQDENSSMHFAEQVANQSSEPVDKCSVNICNHESNYNSDASSMTFAISVSLGLDLTSSSFSTDCSTFQYEPLLADAAPMELCGKEPADLAPLPDQRPPSEQSVPRGREIALEVQNTNAGAFEIRQPAVSKRLIASDSQTFQNDPSPTKLASNDIANEQQSAHNATSSKPANPMPTPKIVCTVGPSSRADQLPTLPTSVQPIPTIVMIPFFEIQDLQVPESRKSLSRPIRHKPVKDDSVLGRDKDFSGSSHSRITHPRMNSKETRFTCDICNKGFSKYYNLARHERSHTDEKKFACEICPKSFTENYLFKRHMTIHTDQKNFACNFCNQTFIRNGSLVRHMMRHTGEKTFACHVCDKKFARNDVLKNHVRTHKKKRVSRNDSLPARTVSLKFDKQQQAYIDPSRILVACPTLMPSDLVILINPNTAEVDVRK